MDIKKAIGEGFETAVKENQLVNVYETVRGVVTAENNEQRMDALDEGFTRATLPGNIYQGVREYQEETSENERPAHEKLRPLEAEILKDRGIEVDPSEVDHSYNTVRREPGEKKPELEGTGIYAYQADDSAAASQAAREMRDNPEPGSGVFYVDCDGADGGWDEFNKQYGVTATPAMQEKFDELSKSGARQTDTSGGIGAGADFGITDSAKLSVDGSFEGGQRNRPDASDSARADAIQDAVLGNFDFAYSVDHIRTAAVANAEAGESTTLILDNGDALSAEHLKEIDELAADLRENQGVDFNVIVTGVEQLDEAGNPQELGDYLRDNRLNVDQENPIPAHLDPERDKPGPEQPEPEQSGPEQPEQPGPEQSGPEQPEQPEPEQPAPDQPGPGHPAPEEPAPAPEQPVAVPGGKPGQNPANIEGDHSVVNHGNINVNHGNINVNQADVTHNQKTELSVQQPLPQHQVQLQPMPQIPQDLRLAEMSQPVYRPDENPGQVSPAPYQDGATFVPANHQPGVTAPTGDIPNFNGFGFDTQTQFDEGTLKSQTTFETPIGGAQLSAYIGQEGIGFNAHGIPANQPIDGPDATVAQPNGGAQSVGVNQQDETAAPAEQPAVVAEQPSMTTSHDLSAELDVEVNVSYNQATYEQPQPALDQSVRGQSTPEQLSDQQGTGQGTAAAEAQAKGKVGVADLAADADGEVKSIQNQAPTAGQQIPQHTQSI